MYFSVYHPNFMTFKEEMKKFFKEREETTNKKMEEFKKFL